MLFAVFLKNYFAALSTKLFRNRAIPALTFSDGHAAVTDLPDRSAMIVSCTLWFIRFFCTVKKEIYVKISRFPAPNLYPMVHMSCLFGKRTVLSFTAGK